MNIIETAKAILSGSDIDPMVIVRAVARLEPVACVNGHELSLFLGDSGTNSVNAWPLRWCRPSDVYLYTLEADK